MSATEGLLQLTIRQPDVTPTPVCETGNDYNGRIGLRVAAIFIIWFGSCIGAVFPVFANRHKGLKVPEWTFFVAKYFGSGVIVATAFIHLLGPAEDALRNPCLTGAITDYSWAEGIILMTIFILFFVELMVMRYGNFGHDHEHEHDHDHDHKREAEPLSNGSHELDEDHGSTVDGKPFSATPDAILPVRIRSRSTHAPGEDHLGHARESATRFLLKTTKHK